MRYALLLLLMPLVAPAEPERRTMNDGQLLLEDVPEIPAAISDAVAPFEHVRQALFMDWLEEGEGMLVRTRFGDVDQLHRVRRAGGARHQLTFGDDPVREARREPGGRRIAFTRDENGDEFDQVYLLDPGEGTPRRLTDGKGRNQALLWRPGRPEIVYQSTRRDGRHTDLWLLPVDRPAQARILLEAPDQSWWLPLDFSPDGRLLLVQQFVSVADSRIHVLNLASGQLRLLAGGGSRPSSNVAAAFGRDGRGMMFITSQRGLAAELAWMPLDGDGRPGGEVEFITTGLGWNVTEFALSPDGRRGAFVVNEGGISRLHLYTADRHQHDRVERMPVGLVSGLRFSPDGRRLAMTVSTAQTPSDVYVLSLFRRGMQIEGLARWTRSEIGGLDTERFVIPELSEYPTFDQDIGGQRRVPAFLYRPPGDGPHPVVIWIHGGPESQFEAGFHGTIQLWLRTLGVAVIAPNVRGSLGYGTEYAALDDGRKREDAVRDIGALLDWIASRDDLDEQRVAVYGASYGGYMALASAIHYPERIRAVVDRVGISNFVTFLEGTQDYRRDVRRREYGDERDPGMRAFLESISPLNRVDAIRAPVLVAQGVNDPRVPVGESRQLVQRLRAQGQEVWYLEAANEGHGLRRRDNRDVWQQAVVLFLQRHLLESGSAAATVEPVAEGG